MGQKAFCRHGIRAEGAAVMTLPQTLFLFYFKNVSKTKATLLNAYFRDALAV